MQRKPKHVSKGAVSQNWVAVKKKEASSTSGSSHFHPKGVSPTKESDQRKPKLKPLKRLRFSSNLVSAI